MQTFREKKAKIEEVYLISYKKGTYFEHAEGQMLRFVYIGVNIYFVTNVTYRNVTI